MNILIFKELKPYSFSELLDVFSIDKEDLNKILKTLSMMNIVRKINKNTSEFELEELLYTDNLEDFDSRFEGTIYVFKYVGMIAIDDKCLIIYPKYLDNYKDDSNDNFCNLKQIIAVIRKYQSKHQKIGLRDEIDTDNFNVLSIALELISNYNEYGLYSNDEHYIEENGYGEILWEKTINEKDVYVVNNVPIYLDTYTTNQQNNIQDYFRRLHAFVITDICKKIKNVLEIIDLEYINISSESKSDFGSVDYILYRLNQELSTQYVTYKQNILKIIKNYIEKNTNSSSSERVSFVGTTSFNLIWEDVCSVLFGDCRKISIGDLGLSYSKNNSQYDLVSDVISKPIWEHIESGSKHNSSKTLVPDIISIKGDELSIYDAKYYNIRLDKDGINNYPGVGDVSKQYLYELAYIEFAKENNLTIKNNAFLMPSDGNDEVVIGKVSMDLFKSIGVKFNDIKIILMPCDRMFKEYLIK